MIVIAKFVGRNTTINNYTYIQDEEYCLRVKNMAIETLSYKGRCMYGSIESFLSNWHIIKTIHE